MTTVTPAMRKAAHQAMTNYVSGLAERVPAGTKAAEVARNAEACGRLQKLASAMSGGKDVFTAVREVYADKNAAYQHSIVSGLVRGLREKLASKQAAAKGISSHPSASVTGKTTTQSSGLTTVGPAMRATAVG
jgi:hypothetical protein